MTQDGRLAVTPVAPVTPVKPSVSGPSGFRSFAWLLVATMALLAGLAPGALAAQGDGNNGTVKVDGVPFDDLRDNEPHPGCRFEIDWFNFDAGAVSLVTFELHPPTGPAAPLLTNAATPAGHGGKCHHHLAAISGKQFRNRALGRVVGRWALSGEGHGQGFAWHHARR